MNTNLIQPDFNIEIEGYQFLGRGPEASSSNNGWERNNFIYYRCVKCGSMMSSLTDENFSCECGSMFVDSDYQRFGSNLGDQNILVYTNEKT